jgi:uroporphyrinogen decarboxylase
MISKVIFLWSQGELRVWQRDKKIYLRLSDGVYFEEMTSRERILAALEHRETDRVPVDFSGHRSSGIAALVYPELRKHLHLPQKTVRVYDMIQQLAVVDEDVLDRFGVDTVEMGRSFLLEESDWKDWILPDGTSCKIPYYIHVERRGEDWYLLNGNGQELAIQKKGCLYFEQTHFPLKDRDFAADDFLDLEDVLSQTVWTGVASPGAHLPLDEEGLAEMAHRAKTLRMSTNRAIIGLFGGNMFEIPQMLFRMDNYLTFLGLYPEKAIRFSEKLCDLHMKSLEKWLGAVGPYIDIILFGDDLGGQTGPLISPRMYRQVFKPFHRKLWHHAKELADVKVMLHCCGGVRALMDGLIDAGLDAINPVQINAAGMDPAELKAEFGDKITLWGGGCDTREILPRCSPGQVAAHVEELVRLLRRGGGFVFQQVHNILADVPAENVAAMFDAVNKSPK